MVAVDGEGIGSRYVLLADSTGRRIHRRSGLRTEECLDFLLSLPEGHAVGFGFDYDANMILADLAGPDGKPGPEAVQLWRTGRTWWRGYKIRYIPRKLFSVRRDGRGRTVFDIMGFFGSSFLTACDRFGIKLPEEVTAGKAARSSFSKWRMEDIIYYNRIEVEALAELAEELRRRLRAGGLEPTRWHGPGAVATTWIRKVRADRWVAEAPREALDAARRAYFGGRIDAVGYGIHEASVRYDLRSAYPWALTQIPDLTDVRWRRIRDPHDLPSLGLLRVRWDVPSPWWGPLPWRDDDGTILWPPSGEGWYWSPEVYEAMERFPGKIRVLGGWALESEGEFPWAPLVRELYEERSRRKEAGDPSELAYKLVLNSLYGKAAQRRGRSPISSWTLAGIITALVRSRIAAAIRRVGEDRVLAVMTDGILIEPGMPPLRTGEGLGDWTCEGTSRLAIAEPGLYVWGGTLYRRGYERDGAPDVESLVRSWISGRQDRELEAPVTRFIGLGAAVEVNGVYRWRTWLRITRRVGAVPLIGTSKRAPEWSGSDRRGDIVRLRPYRRGEPRVSRPVPSRIRISAPYEPHVLDEEVRRRILEDETVEEER